MNGLNGADMTFVTLSAALVMFMIPGLALFYGGMIKSKNVLSTTLQSYAALAVISVQWIVIGYSLSFGTDKGGFIGKLDFTFFKNLAEAANIDYAPTIPHLLFAVFQMMFAVVIAAVISGAFAERMRFSAFLVFLILWTTLVYDPMAHWVWGGTMSQGGWLKELGVQDFAGGLVVEINSGISGLVAVNAFSTTMAAAAAGAIAFAICEWIIHKKPTALGTISGAIAGLVSITPGAGYVSTMHSLLIGFVGGALSFVAIVYLKKKLGYDDTLDAFGCHGVAGIWGTIATGIFASSKINPASADGLIFGNFELFKVQCIAVVACVLYAGNFTFFILKFISKFMKLRTTTEEESAGLDVTLHREKAYNIF